MSNDAKKIYSLAASMSGKDSEQCSYEVYEEYLNQALEDKSIRNIAITGNYGVGKSSFLNWYTQKKDENYLFVSLCDFTIGDKKKSTDEIGEDICKQLYVGCSKAREQNRKWHVFIVFICTLIICCLSTFYILKNDLFGSFDHFNNILSKIKSSPITPVEFEQVEPWFDIFCGAICILGFPVIIAKLAAKVTVSKFTLKAKDVEGELELNHKKSTGYLDSQKLRLVDELRKSARHYGKVVIFEDFDRTGCADCASLFTDLHEINRLVNIMYARRQPIRFIYVLQDGVFDIHKNNANTGNSNNSNGTTASTYEQQLKFFDYIMPFIPTMLGTASAEHIRTCLGNILTDDENTIEEYVNKVSSYIFDYRTIRNIANEYSIISDICEALKSKIGYSNEEKHRINKEILALATYKTLMPSDYALIRCGQSILWRTNLTSAEKRHVNPCILNLLDEGWLGIYSLEYVGISHSEMKKYVETIISKGNVDLSMDYIKRNYSILRYIMLGDESFFELLLTNHAYTLLYCELKTSKTISKASLFFNQSKKHYNIKTKETININDANIISAIQESPDCCINVVEFLLMFGKDISSWSFVENANKKLSDVFCDLPDVTAKLFIETVNSDFIQCLKNLSPQEANQFLTCLEKTKLELLINIPSLQLDIKQKIDQRLNSYS